MNFENYLRQNPFKIISICVIGFISFLLLLGSFYTVDSGERAIVLRFGTVTGVSSDGLHFKVPLIDRIVTTSVRTMKASSPSTAGTNDLQTVKTEVAVNYHFDPAKLAEIYSKTGLLVRDKIVEPRIHETVKAVVARYTAEQLLKKREEVKESIVDSLRKSLSTYHIVLEDVQLTDFSFSASFDDAIEAKQTAEQNALKAKNDLDRIEVEAEQKIAMAKAEAESIRIQTAAIREQGGQAYVQLKAIERWDGALPKMSGGAVPFVDINKL